jgi:hypothetical protein
MKRGRVKQAGQEIWSSGWHQRVEPTTTIATFTTDAMQCIVGSATVGIWVIIFLLDITENNAQNLLQSTSVDILMSSISNIDQYSPLQI